MFQPREELCLKAKRLVGIYMIDSKAFEKKEIKSKEHFETFDTLRITEIKSDTLALRYDSDYLRYKCFVEETKDDEIFITIVVDED